MRHPAASLMHAALRFEDPSTWVAGVEGEEETALALEGAPSYAAYHSVPIGPGVRDLDHLLVGPGGVFAVNTKHHHGRSVLRDGDELVVDGWSEDHVSRARAEALAVEASLGRSLRRVPTVTAVLSMPCLDSLDSVGVNDVEVIRAEDLADLLEGRPRVLHERQVEAVVAAVEDPATWRGTLDDDEGVLERYRARFGDHVGCPRPRGTRAGRLAEERARELVRSRERLLALSAVGALALGWLALLFSSLLAAPLLSAAATVAADRLLRTGGREATSARRRATLTVVALASLASLVVVLAADLASLTG